MTTRIIQHHPEFDLETFFNNIYRQQIGNDFDDYQTFMDYEGEKHSFIGIAEGEGRVTNALGNAIASREAQEIINRATCLVFRVVRSLEGKHPLVMDEMKDFFNFLDGINEDCDVGWGVAEDSTLGDAVKVIVLANVKD